MHISSTNLNNNQNKQIKNLKISCRSYLVREAHHELHFPAPCRANIVSLLLLIPIVKSVDHMFLFVAQKGPVGPILLVIAETNQPNDDIVMRKKHNLCKTKINTSK
jgi:hypothetical protein